MNWRLLILTLPTENTAARMRAWRSLKACGAAVIRDGVYAMPDQPEHASSLAAIAADLTAHGGSTWSMLAQADDARIISLFDRSEAFGDLLAELGRARNDLAGLNAGEAGRRLKRLRRQFEQVASTDFFPGEARAQTEVALNDLERALRSRIAPDEPQGKAGGIVMRELARYQGRQWATRRRPWVDRLASAWLIRRFIDPRARFLWLKAPEDCPRKAIGFDFDGAEFSHIDGRVTFEHLVAAFRLESVALARIGVLVHGLDAGGVQPPEAPGVERVLAGMREAITDDDQLLLAAAGVFEGLLVAFEKTSEP